MATYLLKKSYQLKDLQEVSFKDLWGDNGIFTTMWIFGKSPKILFFENHIKNLIRSLQVYGIKKKSLKKDILKVVNINISKQKSYNHLLRIALNKKIISISLRKRIPPKLDFNLKLVNLKREKPKYKNLKYKKILSYLIRMDNSKSDIGLINKKKILETGTSNLLFIKDDKVFSPSRNYYEGNTFKFFKTKINKIIKKDIYIKELNNYDEIILVGSGKGVASVKTINQIGWKRKSLRQFKIFSRYYHSAVKKCTKYKF
ncbi:aminotransferase class IV [Pelagibacterales bacterium SAG-MED01]|nr:aminotransferase class IV [Pelagibacterales bacterium SAG-MED01]